MNHCAAIVQARIGSSRLPGKVLLDIGGKSVLAHVLERARAIRLADAVCCAVPIGTDNDAVAIEAQRCGSVVFRGSEHDVLDRYYQAAKHLNVSEIMRITSDCPLIDPAICDAVIELRRELVVDYAANDLEPVWPHGLDCEVFSFAWLERSAREAVKPSDREHVTLFMRNHPDAKKAMLRGPGGELSKMRWTLDTPADLSFLRALMPLLPAGAKGFDYRTVVDAVRANPQIAAINAGQDRFAGLKASLANDQLGQATGGTVG